MGKSAAQKKRAHQMRNNGKDVTMFRNEVDFSTHLRKSKTKTEKLNQLHTKHKKHFTKGIVPNGNAFYYAYYSCICLVTLLYFIK
ncbi:hypothetical protein [Psychrobacillus sp. OK032]|uniref:hypothetical protein n=1 Tax=Psychrobacillus sp. OK032 TaxID=1884358 RepID=UPI0008B28BC9|nr:hypothetical protein [Psychrobacillus sp. OK032]SES11371.1 hypothetical protein SAMN05518872_104268 [Psychrobacillus sp. OK032]